MAEEKKNHSGWIGLIALVIFFLVAFNTKGGLENGKQLVQALGTWCCYFLAAWIIWNVAAWVFRKLFNEKPLKNDGQCTLVPPGHSKEEHSSSREKDVERETLKQKKVTDDGISPHIVIVFLGVLMLIIVVILLIALPAPGSHASSQPSLTSTSEPIKKSSKDYSSMSTHELWEQVPMKTTPDGSRSYYDLSAAPQELVTEILKRE